MMTPLLAGIGADRRGVAAIEFALLAPALIAMLLGLLDLAHTMYAVQMLQGAIQQVARNATIEGASSRSPVIDRQVIAAVRAVVPGAAVSFSRKSYTNFTETSRPEDYTDVNGNGTCDADEPFEDANGNDTWDTDPGRTGFGGARDVLLYQVFVRYPRRFAIHQFVPGMGSTVSLTARTVLRNQPFGAQHTNPAPVTGFCP